MSVFGIILLCIFPKFSHIRTAWWEILSISPYSVRMRENARKMRTRITPNTDTFYAVSVWKILIMTTSFYKASKWTPSWESLLSRTSSLRNNNSTVNYLPYVDDNHKTEIHQKQYVPLLTFLALTQDLLY